MAPVDPEVPLQREPGPASVLHGERAVEQVLVPDRLNGGGIGFVSAKRGRRVAGNRADADEDEHADGEHYDERRACPLENEGAQGYPDLEGFETAMGSLTLRPVRDGEITERG